MNLAGPSCRGKKGRQKPWTISRRPFSYPGCCANGFKGHVLTDPLVVVITPVFKDRGPGGYKIVMVFAKHQRGAMARYIIQHRILEPEKLKAYDGDGYRYTPEESTAEEWVYLREKKP